MKRTKIVATISDWRSDVAFLNELYEAGMNVVRLNSAHLDEEGFSKIINNVRQVSSSIGILMDTKGPEIRTTVNEGNVKFSITMGDRVRVIGDPSKQTTQDTIYVSYEAVSRDLSIGDNLLIDDGEIDYLVVEKHEGYLVCEAQNNGELGSRKSVNVPGVRISLPSLTEKDKMNILYAITHEIDFIAHSFVRSKQDVLDIQEILDEHNSPIKIIAKIENQEGVDRIDEILEVTYGVMIARGDLGIEIPQEKIPGIQRILIKKCVQARKPVIVATQMLHSMINNPRPTRAEVTDIANAIYYRTDALMLSGETAYGKYPVEAVRTMSSIAREAELTKMRENDIPLRIEIGDKTTFFADQAKLASRCMGVTAIINDAYTGKTARYVAAYRNSIPTIAICIKERLMRELALSYGVIPVFQTPQPTLNANLVAGLKNLTTEGLVQPDEQIAYLGGLGAKGGCTYLEINHIQMLLDHENQL